MDKEQQYKLLAQLEMETTKIRHTTFTAILSISFILPALALKATDQNVTLCNQTLPLSNLVFFLGFLFYLFAVFHYTWYHRYAHKYRKALKDLEEELDIRIYRLRRRPRIGRFKFHFDRALYTIGVVYGLITGQLIGWTCFLAGISVVIILYFLFLLNSLWSPEEPLEESPRQSK